jgi:threonine/homoserine/homoserine lactone efflux protein
MGAFFEAIYSGVALGMTLCFSLGPSFFALISTSLKKGYRSGIDLAIGIFLSDLLCVALAYLGATKILGKPENKLIVGVIGGTILAVYGFYNVFAKKKMVPDEGETMEFKTTSPYLTILKGFMLNILNPFVILLWVGWMGLISSKASFNTWHVTVFFVTTLIVVLGTDILKALIAHRIKAMLKPAVLIWVNRIVGLIMIGCGVWMVARVL